MRNREAHKLCWISQMFHEISRLRFLWVAGSRRRGSGVKIRGWWVSFGLVCFLGVGDESGGGEDGRGWLLPSAVPSPACERLGNKKRRNFFCRFASMRRTVPVLLFCYKFVWCYEVAGGDEKGGFGLALVALPFFGVSPRCTNLQVLRSSATLCKISHDSVSLVTLRYFSNLMLL